MMTAIRYTARRLSTQLALVSLLAIAAAPALAGGTATQTLIVGQRSYTLPSNTPILLDEQPAVLSDLLGRPAGLQLRWQADAVRGAAVPVFSYTVIGPVTSIAPLQVLGQSLTVTADTVIAGVDNVGELAVGMPVVVAGLVDANGSVYTSLIEVRGAQGNRFLLAGRVEEVLPQPGRLRVGSQWLMLTAGVVSGCAAASPVVGEHVEMRADAIVGFQPGGDIDTVTALTCTTLVPFGTPGASGAIEGVVSAALSGTQFAIGDLIVTHGPDTVFEFGGPDDLEPGNAVGIEGTFVSMTELLADGIEFVRPVVRFEAPMTPADTTPGVSLRPFGVEVFSSAQLRDDDDIMLSGLSQPRQVRVRGWLDGVGVAYATRVRDRGAPDAADVALRGPISAIADPQLTVQGLTVDTTGALLFDADEMPLTPAELFAQVRRNQVVDVSGAQWNAQTRTLSGGSVILLGYEHTEPVPGDLPAVLAGTVRSYRGTDAIFGDGFEVTAP